MSEVKPVIHILPNGVEIIRARYEDDTKLRFMDTTTHEVADLASHVKRANDG